MGNLDKDIWKMFKKSKKKVYGRTLDKETILKMGEGSKEAIKIMTSLIKRDPTGNVDIVILDKLGIYGEDICLALTSGFDGNIEDFSLGLKKEIKQQIQMSCFSRS